MSSPRVLLSAVQIQARVRELAAQIDQDLASRTRSGSGTESPAVSPDGETVCLVGVLKGSWIFLADLARCLQTSVRIEFLRASSYGDGQESSGTIRLLQDLDAPIEGQDVILVEDIVDTGLTMQYLLNLLRARQPRSLQVVALLDKPGRRRCDVRADYVGFEIGDQFVVGYGLDAAERYRGLPDVCVLEP